MNLKFKAYIKKINCICIVESLHLVERKPYVIIGGDKYLLDEVELMRYINATDKNDTEIYEGDIVKNFHNKVGVVEYGEYSTMKESHIGFFSKHKIGISLLRPKEHIEVIGNIYQNIENKINIRKD